MFFFKYKGYLNFNYLIRKQQNLINYYLKEKGVDAKLQMRIKKYLVDVWEAKKRNLMTTQGLIEMIPSDYKLEVLSQIYGRPLLKNKVILRWFGIKTMKKLCLLCKEKSFLPNEAIYDADAIDDCNYNFIESGRVELFLKRDQHNFILNILSVLILILVLPFNILFRKILGLENCLSSRISPELKTQKVSNTHPLLQ